MALITRCPACGTMFKVVADQLKVSQGWVRCGHCADVFDASLQLLPRETESLAPAAPALDAAVPELVPASLLQNAAEPEALQEVAGAPAGPLVDRERLKPALSERDDAQDSAADIDPASWKLVQQADQQEQARSAQAEAAAADLPPRLQELVHTQTLDESEPGLAPVVVADSTIMDSDIADSEATPDVSFVRDARRKAFWTQPQARWWLGTLTVLLLAALLVQAMMQQKDTLAALDPRFAPLLQTLCRPLGCEIRPPRHIESLVIDSSSFNRIGPDVYRLNFSLKNTAAASLEMPSLEVTLTDAQDQAVVRRVLEPALFGAGSVTLDAHSELAGAVTMKVSGDTGRANASPSSSSASSAPASPLRVAGYRVLAFYP